MFENLFLLYEISLLLHVFFCLVSCGIMKVIYVEIQKIYLHILKEMQFASSLIQQNENALSLFVWPFGPPKQLFPKCLFVSLMVLHGPMIIFKRSFSIIRIVRQFVRS